MELREALLEEHSKNQTDKIIGWIGRDKARIAALMTLFNGSEYRVVQRAAWVISGVAEQHPKLMAPYIPVLVGRLQDKKAHAAVKRNVFRLLQFIELPEAVHGELMNIGFDALANPAEALAVRASAMTVLARLARIYPELSNELKVILEEALQHEKAPSFRSRGLKVLQQVKRLAE